MVNKIGMSVQGGQKEVYSCLYERSHAGCDYNNTKINSVLRAHNCKPALTHPCVFIDDMHAVWGLLT